jgi:hypothetical protein
MYFEDYLPEDLEDSDDADDADDECDMSDAAEAAAQAIAEVFNETKKPIGAIKIPGGIFYNHADGGQSIVLDGQKLAISADGEISASKGLQVFKLDDQVVYKTDDGNKIIMSGGRITSVVLANGETFNFPKPAVNADAPAVLKPEKNAATVVDLPGGGIFADTDTFQTVKIDGEFLSVNKADGTLSMSENSQTFKVGDNLVIKLPSGHKVTMTNGRISGFATSKGEHVVLKK